MPIPKESKQPKEVFQIFYSLCKDESQDIISLLTRLFFAVASPTVFYQLRDACTASRQDEIHRVLQPTADVLQTLQALDKLDTNVSTASILRRYHLTYLAACRRQKEEHIKSGKRRVPRKLKYGVSSTQTQRVATGSNNDESSALAAMMKEVYPILAKKTNEYQKVYQSLVVAGMLQVSHSADRLSTVITVSYIHLCILFVHAFMQYSLNLCVYSRHVIAINLVLQERG